MRTRQKIRLRPLSASAEANAASPSAIRLPLVDPRESAFLKLYAFSGFSAAQCYRWAFDATASLRACAVSACHLLREPRIVAALWDCARYQRFPLSPLAVKRLTNL